jgi:hypothetical protein
MRLVGKEGEFHVFQRRLGTGDRAAASFYGFERAIASRRSYLRPELR